MDNGRQTFIDPKTGEETESTPLARFASGFLWAFACLSVPICAVGWGHRPAWQIVALGLLMALLSGLCRVIVPASAHTLWSRLAWTRRVAVAIARWQHRRRKREGGADV